MSRNIGDQYSIHLSDLDEFLASRLLEAQGTLSFSICKTDLQGNIRIQQKEVEGEIEEGGIDFELSPSEYQSLDSIKVSDFTANTVYTSSAYEFFDFILMYLSELECILDFNGNSWRIRITGFTEIE